MSSSDSSFSVTGCVSITAARAQSVVSRRTLLLGLLLGVLSSTTSGSGATGSGGTTGTAGGNGSELGRALSDQLYSMWSAIVLPRAIDRGLVGWLVRTSLMSLPSSSEMSLVRRSASASMPTDSRTALMSEAEGLALPPSWRRR